MTDQTNIVARGNTVINFVDQYGDERVIHSQHGRGLRIKKNTDTVSHHLNRAAAELIGDRIKAKRLQRGLTLDGLLSKAGLVAAPGLGKSRMYEIESAGRGHARANKFGIRFGTLYALAIALECSLADLLPSPEEVAMKAGVALDAAPKPERRVHKQLQAAQ